MYILTLGGEMTEYKYVNIRLPEAKRLADLYGIAIDLDACRRYCEKYIQLSTSHFQPIQEGQHTECFVSYVFVKYGRCFGNGVRVNVEKEIMATLSPEDFSFHRLVIGIRDKYIAHSVNDFESHKVRVWLHPEERGRKVDNVNIESSYVMGPGVELFKRLKSLIDNILTWINSEKKREEKRLTQLVNEKYDLDYLYSLDAEALDSIDYSRALKTRKGP
jgi:hypothetical protein